MFTYLDLLRDVMENGDDILGRNSMTRSVFGRQSRYNLQDGFPALTTDSTCD